MFNKNEYKSEEDFESLYPGMLEEICECAYFYRIHGKEKILKNNPHNIKIYSFEKINDTNIEFSFIFIWKDKNTENKKEVSGHIQDGNFNGTVLKYFEEIEIKTISRFEIMDI